MPTAPALSKETKIAIGIILGALVVRIAFAAILDFTADETYDVIMARQPALGYADHPPLAMWLIAAIRLIAGAENPLLVRLPTLLLFVGTSWFIYLLASLLFSRRAGLYAVILLTLSPLFAALGTLALTDGPTFFATVASAYFLARAVNAPPDDPAWRDWLLAGAFFGLSLLSKYITVLLLPGLLVFLLSVPSQRRWFLRPSPYAALALALLLAMPMVLWNAENGWVSFTFQGRRAALEAFHPERLGLLLGGLFLALLPPVFVALVAGLVDGFRRGPSDQGRWLLVWLASGPILLFAVIWLFGPDARRGFHWFAPGLILLFPLAGALLADLSDRRLLWLRDWSIVVWSAVFAIVVAIYASHALTGWITNLVPSYRTYDDLLADQTDWHSLRTTLAERNMLDPDRYFIAVARWDFCYRVEYVIKGDLPVVCLSDNSTGFGPPTRLNTLVGKDAIFIRNWSQLSEERTNEFVAQFAGREPDDTIAIRRMGRPVMMLDVAVLRGLQQPLLARSFGTPAVR